MRENSIVHLDSMAAVGGECDWMHQLEHGTQEASSVCLSVPICK